MKMAKAIRRQAATAERVAATTADAFVANQMRSLAQAFRSQADVLNNKNRRRRRNELLYQGNVQAWGTRSPPQDLRGGAARRPAQPLVSSDTPTKCALAAVAPGVRLRAFCDL